MPDSITAPVKQRKVYVQPQVEVIDLLPKQTVLGGCLTASTVGGIYVGATDPGCGTSSLDPKCSY